LVVSAKVQAGAAAGLLLGHTHSDVVSHFAIEVIPELGVELALEAVAAAKALPPVHRAPPSAA
jgi:hypothetical protein